LFGLFVSKRKDSMYRSGRSPDWLKNEELGRAAVKRLPRKIGAGEVLGLSQAH